MRYDYCKRDNIIISFQNLFKNIKGKAERQMSFDARIPYIKTIFKILPKYSILILSFRANNKLDTTCANSNASKQIIYLKCIIWWKCPKLSHKEIETDLSFWKRSLRLREKFCKNQLPIYHTSQKSFIPSQHLSATFFIKWDIFIFFVHQDQFDHLKNIFFTSFKLRHELKMVDITRRNFHHFHEFSIWKVAEKNPLN